jgi:pimeloyl-ACP methyl ester carboxylesterase
MTFRRSARAAGLGPAGIQRGHTGRRSSGYGSSVRDMDIILIAGLWLDGSAWDDVVPALRGLGHRPVPLTLPGQGDGLGAATLADQAAAVLAAVDSASGRPLVVGHSAACTLAWLAADARPDGVAGVVLIGGWPSADGEPYADFFATVDGVMPFPGWDPFEGPDAIDLDEEARRAFTAAAIPVPVGVTKGLVRLTDERRFSVPVTLVCPEFTPGQAREWIAEGELAELANAEHLDLVDIDSGHWPMLTRPAELARLLAAAATGVGGD